VFLVGAKLEREPPRPAAVPPPPLAIAAGRDRAIAQIISARSHIITTLAYGCYSMAYIVLYAAILVMPVSIASTCMQKILAQDLPSVHIVFMTSSSTVDDGAHSSGPGSWHCSLKPANCTINQLLWAI
jgi:hypothetical protein